MPEDTGLPLPAGFDSLDELVRPIILERRRQRLSQQALAERAGLSRRALLMIEAGGDCTLSSLRRLYTALGLEVQAHAWRAPTLDEQVARNREEFQRQETGAARPKG